MEYTDFNVLFGAKCLSLSRMPFAQLRFSSKYLTLLVGFSLVPSSIIDILSKFTLLCLVQKINNLVFPILSYNLLAFNHSEVCFKSVLGSVSSVLKLQFVYIIHMSSAK